MLAIFALCVLNYDDFECILWSVVKNLCWNSQKWVISHFKTILHSWEIWQIILNVVEVSSLRISNKQLQRNVRTDDESQKKMQQKCAQDGYCLVFAKCRVTHDNGEECEKKHSISENRIQWSALATILANILSSPNSVHHKKFVTNFLRFLLHEQLVVNTPNIPLSTSEVSRIRNEFEHKCLKICASEVKICQSHFERMLKSHAYAWWSSTKLNSAPSL